jgi:hypothetical protein
MLAIALKALNIGKGQEKAAIVGEEPAIIEVNGLPVDARMMPREVQEEAHRLGLIPYGRRGLQRLGGYAEALMETRYEHITLNEDRVPRIAGTTIEVV